VLQERDAARTSKLFLGGETALAAAPALALAEPASTHDIAGHHVRRTQPEDATPNGARPPSAPSSRTMATNQRTVSAERLSAPASPYVVQAGSM
jgi:hypothetical protein